MSGDVRELTELLSTQLIRQVSFHHFDSHLSHSPLLLYAATPGSELTCFTNLYHHTLFLYAPD